MALFQPTNITPDLKGGVKNGYIIIPADVDTPDNVEVSWTVNGNSQLTAYQIDFFQNTAASTQTGSTGKITVYPAFSAIAADGTQTRFTATVSYSLFSGAFSPSAPLQGKLKITQWWATGSVEQRSLSVFNVSKEGSLYIYNKTGTGGNLTFFANYLKPIVGSYGDIPLNWTRWEILLPGGVVRDTGKIWGATEYVWSPETLAPLDYAYVCRVTAEMANGAEISNTMTFTVDPEEYAEAEGFLSVSCDSEESAVKISAPNLAKPIESVYYGSYTLTDNSVILDNDLSGADYTFPAVFNGTKWSFIWHGKIGTGAAAPDDKLFELEMTDGTKVWAQYNSGRSPNPLTLQPGGSPALDVQLYDNDEIYIIFTFGYFTDGTDADFQWLIYGPDVQGYDNIKITGFTQMGVSGVSIFGPSTVYGWQLGYGNSNSALAAGMSDPDAVTDFSGPRIQFPYHDDGSAALLPLGDPDAPLALYRWKGNVASDAGTFVGVFLEPPDATLTPYILDYAATNGELHSYYAAGYGEGMENGALATSRSVQPCFWDWLLIEAKQDGPNAKTYQAVNVFRFQGNVESGSYTNRAGRNIQPTFTPYPAVFRSTQNSRQGTLTGLIGVVKNGNYTDTNATEEAILALSSTQNQLFLRDRRGRFWKIALAGEITMSVNDRTAQQEITASVPWVEVGNTDGVSVYRTGWDMPTPEPDPH